MRTHRLGAAMLLGGALLALPARAIEIVPTFDPSLADPRSTGTFTAVEAALVDQAICAWRTGIQDPRLVDIVFLKTNQAVLQGLIGLAADYKDDIGTGAGVPQAGNPRAGVVLIDDGAFVSWFVDPDPTLDQEFGALPGLPATYKVAPAASPAVGLHDMLSTLTHEIGHVLGFTSSYVKFAANVQLSPPLPIGRAAYEFIPPPVGLGPQLGDPVLDYNAPFFPLGGAFLINPAQEVGGDGEGPPGLLVGGIPSHLDDLGGPGPEAGYFDLDAMNRGLSPGERRLIAEVDLDILSDAFGYLPVGDPDGDGVLGDDDSCPTLPNTGLDSDFDGVDDACDTCLLAPNPAVAAADIEPWMNLVNGQRDDDVDGFGNACDADFDNLGAVVGGVDLSLHRASFNQPRAGSTCGAGTDPCGKYDMDGVGAVIGGNDLTLGRALFNQPPGPNCGPGCAPPFPPAACPAPLKGTCYGPGC